MEFEFKNLDDQCNFLINKINQIQADLKKAVHPNRPQFQKEPFMPYLEPIEDLNFFNGFFLLAVIVLIPSYVLMKIILEIEGYSYLIVAGVVLLIILAYNYSSRIEDNRAKEKRNKVKTNKYQQELRTYQEYQQKEQLYQERLDLYKEQIRSINRNAYHYKEQLGQLLKPKLEDSDEVLRRKNDLRKKWTGYVPQEYHTISKLLTPSVTPSTNSNYSKASRYLAGISSSSQSKILDALREVQKVQRSSLSDSAKIKGIKDILWTNQSMRSRLVIGGFLGALVGLTIFGTGGVGIAALGGAVGIWGWFLTSMGGAAVASIISNFEKRN